MSISDTVTLYDLIHQCIAAEQPMVVLYDSGGRAEEKARVLYPSRLWSTGEGADCIRAFDSYRGEARTFRVDRILHAHHLTA